MRDEFVRDFSRFRFKEYCKECVSMSLISTAYAATTGAAAAGNGAQQGANPLNLVLMMVVFIVIFYLLLWRPQSKKAKEQRNLINKLQAGDEVVTAGGFMGKIVKIKDNMIVLKIAKETEVRIQKSSISTVLPKGSLKDI